MSPESSERRQLCEARLAELTPMEITGLTEFAESRLVTFGFPPSHGQDISQQALVAVLNGLETDQGGRIPRPVDLQHKVAFLNYLRGVISSLVWNMTRRAEFRAHPQWIDALGLTQDSGGANPANEACIKDLEEQLFQRLQDRAPARLQSDISAWKRVFPYADRVPARQRKNAYEIRILAREILQELGGIN